MTRADVTSVEDVEKTLTFFLDKKKKEYEDNKSNSSEEDFEEDNLIRGE